jgi:hypothetical protein
MYHQKYLKYKIKYNQLKNKLLGGRIPIIENLVIPLGMTKQTYLEDMTRKDFLDNVALLFNMQKSKSSIKDTQGHYIHFVPGTTPYKLTEECMLTLESSTTPEQNEILESNPKKHYKDFFNSYIKIGSHKIPYVYLFINQVEIFNLIIIIFKHTLINPSNNSKSQIQKDTSTLKDIFNFDTEFNFIGLSYRFNIFNLSLFTNTFFEIVELILDNLESDKKTDIETKLKEIYNLDKKQMIINLYDLIYYRFCFNIITKKINNLYETRLNNLYSIDNSGPYVSDCIKILKNEEGLLVNNTQEDTNTQENTNTKYNDVISILAKQLLLIIDTLKTGQELFKNDDISKVFLFAILSYRLTNRYIYGTWAFSPKYILDYFNGKKSTKILSKKLKLDTPTLKPNFVNTYLSLNLVEYSRVSYKNKTFSNCVENAFLQFLKVIFWNDEIGEYNYDKIKQKIKEEYQPKIYKILQETKDYDETSQKFSDKWLDFLYNLIKPKFISDTCELCSCDITNLYEFLYKLFKININELTISNIDFFRLIDDKLSMESNNDTTTNIILSDGPTITDIPNIYKYNDNILLKYGQYTLEITVSHSKVVKNDSDNEIHIEIINKDFSIILKYHYILKYKYFLLLLLLQYFNNEDTQPIVFTIIMKYLYILDLYIQFFNMFTCKEDMYIIYLNGIKQFLIQSKIQYDIVLFTKIIFIKNINNNISKEFTKYIYNLWKPNIIFDYINNINNYFINSLIVNNLFTILDFINYYLDNFKNFIDNHKSDHLIRICLLKILNELDKISIDDKTIIYNKIYDNLLYLLEYIDDFKIIDLDNSYLFYSILFDKINSEKIIDLLKYIISQSKETIISKIIIQLKESKLIEILIELDNDTIVHIICLLDNDITYLFNKINDIVVHHIFNKLDNDKITCILGKINFNNLDINILKIIINIFSKNIKVLLDTLNITLIIFNNIYETLISIITIDNYDDIIDYIFRYYQTHDKINILFKDLLKNKKLISKIIMYLTPKLIKILDKENIENIILQILDKANIQIDENIIKKILLLLDEIKPPSIIDKFKIKEDIKPNKKLINIIENNKDLCYIIELIEDIERSDIDETYKIILVKYITDEDDREIKERIATYEPIRTDMLKMFTNIKILCRLNKEQ